MDRVEMDETSQVPTPDLSIVCNIFFFSLVLLYLLMPSINGLVVMDTMIIIGTMCWITGHRSK